MKLIIELETDKNTELKEYIESLGTAQHLNDNFVIHTVDNLTMLSLYQIISECQKIEPLVHFEVSVLNSKGANKNIVLNISIIEDNSIIVQANNNIKRIIRRTSYVTEHP